MFPLNPCFGPRPDGSPFPSFPFLFAGRTGDRSYAVAPPLLYGRASDDAAGTSSTYLLDTYYGSPPDGYTLASFPFLLAGRTGGQSYLVAPPPLHRHSSDDAAGT